eukprot:SAG22_NODE_6743_length_817_cov_0.938719_2_plen_167_part_00
MNKHFTTVCQDKWGGDVLSATLRVKPGENASWGLCTFRNAAAAEKAVQAGFAVKVEGKFDAGKLITLDVKLADVHGQMAEKGDGHDGALASMANRVRAAAFDAVPTALRLSLGVSAFVAHHHPLPSPHPTCLPACLPAACERDGGDGGGAGRGRRDQHRVAAAGEL